MDKKWKKQKIIGVGAYGTVYLATPENTNDASAPVVAVKPADIEHASSLLVESLYLDELRGSPNIIHCFGNDASYENGIEVFNLLLEYAPMGSLHDLIQKNKGFIPEPLVACYTLMLLKGLSAIHDEKIVHCDIKPENILVFPGRDNGIINQLNISDFGLAKKVVDLSQGSIGRRRYRGTPPYSAPKYVIHGIHETSSDIWSLGCTVVEMLMGERIWSSCKNISEIELEIMFCEPKIPQNISQVGKDFLRRCFRREYDRRWTTRMLLDHPFIVKNMVLLYGIIHPTGNCCQGLLDQFDTKPFGYARWISTHDMFSTSSPQIAA